jgi:hypothetical protein
LVRIIAPAIFNVAQRAKPPGGQTDHRLFGLLTLESMHAMAESLLGGEIPAKKQIWHCLHSLLNYCIFTLNPIIPDPNYSDPNYYY